MNLCDLCCAMLLLSALASFPAPSSVASFSSEGTTSSPDEAGKRFRAFFRADSAPSAKSAAFSSWPVANFLFRASFLFASAPPPRKHNTGWNAGNSSESSLSMCGFATINQWLLCPPIYVVFWACIKAGQQKTSVMMQPLKSGRLSFPQFLR